MPPVVLVVCFSLHDRTALVARRVLINVRLLYSMSIPGHACFCR